jgi:hypothetical protein
MRKYFRIAFTASLTFVLVSNNVLPIWGDVLLILAAIGSNVSEIRDKTSTIKNG